MDRKWKLIYQYVDEVFKQKEKGEWPSCLPDVWRGGRGYPDADKRIAVPDRPDDIFVLCGDYCRRHLYWVSINLDPAVHNEIPIVVVQVYEKQGGKISEIDEYIALEDIFDEEIEELRELLRRAEESARRAGAII